eukprot:2175305-Prorocentrum_lima.AAC.1
MEAFCLSCGRRCHAASCAWIVLLLPPTGVRLVCRWRLGSDTAVCTRPEELTEGLLFNMF